jgi:septum formation protein
MLYNFPYKIILASQSPRRQELLKGLDIHFDVFVKEDIDESYPSTLLASEVAEFLSQKKAKSYIDDLKKDELLITADTVVILNDKILEKPQNQDDALRMIKELSGKSHEVLKGVSLTSREKQTSFSSISEVVFSELSDEEVSYYVEKYRPYDKAGAYGIQEWIGYIGVEKIVGSYFNVMGLPVQQLYQMLKTF